MDNLSEAYNTNPRDILGNERDERWSWREMLVSSQAVKRRIERREAAQREQETYAELRAQVDKRVPNYDSDV